MFSLKKLITFAVLLTSAEIFANTNLIVNPAWQGANPRPWRGENFSIRSGVAVISSVNGKLGSLWQPFEKAKPGKVYRMTADIRSNSANSLRFCGYWPAKVDGKTVSQCSDNWQWISADKQWKKFETIIKFPKNATRCPYISIAVRNGSVEVRNWQLLELTGEEAEFFTKNLMANPTWRGNPPVQWRSEKFDIRDGFAVVAAENGKNCSLWQPFTTAKGGKRYLMSAELRSDGDNSFRFCGYWPAKVNGKTVSQCSDNWRWLRVGTAWHRFETIIKFPENAIRYPYLSLTVREGSVEVRNWMLVELPPEENPSPALGGTWVLNTKTKVGFDKDDPKNKYPEVPEISIHVPGAVLENIKLDPAKKYQLEFEVIGKGESGTTTGFHGYRLEFMNSSGKSLYRVPWQDVWNGSWQKKTVRMDFVPQGTSKISLRLYASAKGFVAFRNFKLSTFVPDPFEKYGIVLTSPGYRNALYSSMPVKEISGFITSDGRAASGTIRLLDNGKELGKSSFGKDGKFVIPVIPAENGEYKLEAVVRGSDGKILTTLTAPLYRYAQAPHEFVQGENRNFYMDGKPLFPVLFMTNPGGAECIKAAANAGFTGYLQLAGSEAAAWRSLEQAKNSRQKLILGIRYCEDGSLEAWKTRVNSILSDRVKAHSALLGYFLADEPLWVGANINWFTKSAEYLRTIDPFHPVWMNSAPLSTIEENRPYCDVVDINGIDIYPIPYPSGHSSLDDKYPTCVGKYTQTMYETTYGRKSIWMVLQGTSWHEMGGNRKGTYPTLNELRFMNYDAIFNGSNGLVYWGTNYTKSAKFFRDLRQAVKEIYLLSPVLLDGKRTTLPAPAKARLIRVDLDGKSYFIAFNDFPETREITLKPGKDGDFTVLFEERTITAAGGVITDKFEPFACHWYSADVLPETEKLPEFQFAQDPFDKLCHLRTVGRKRFVSQAAWIWDAATASAQGSRATVQKRFSLDSAPRKAVLLIGADDHADVFINGKRAGSHSTWNLIKSLDVTALLKAGENVIEAEVSDSGHLPCGFIAELQYEDAYGKTHKIVTDASWQGTPVKGKPFTPVKVLAPLGFGAWGQRVFLDE